MKRCCKCKCDGDEDSFYSNNPMCKCCINVKRKTKWQSKIDKAVDSERTQAAIRRLVKQFQPNKEPYVYLLEAFGNYKIGFSANVDNRVRAFNTSNCTPCAIVAVAPGGASTERGLHTRFAFHRINREWFNKNPNILTAFKNLPGAMVFLDGYLTEEFPGSLPDVPPGIAGILKVA